jgi:hypothetical protein
MIQKEVTASGCGDKLGWMVSRGCISGVGACAGLSRWAELWALAPSLVETSLESILPGSRLRILFFFGDVHGETIT